MIVFWPDRRPPVPVDPRAALVHCGTSGKEPNQARVGLYLLLFWVALSGATSAQSFKSSVSLVAVDVTVLDSQGRPVAGLGAVDFEVKLNGRRRPVRTISYLQAQTVEAPSDGRQFDMQTAVTLASTAHAEPRTFVIAVDDLSWTFDRGKALLYAARRFVDQLPAGDLVGVATTSGSSFLNPTADRRAVNEVLGRVVGVLIDSRTDVSSGDDVAVGMVESLEIASGSKDSLKVAILRECPRLPRTLTVDQMLSVSRCADAVERLARRTAAMASANTARQLSAIEGIVGAMGVAPGIKHLVWLSDGVALGRDIAGVLPVARAASIAGVHISVLSEEPDFVMGDSQSGAALRRSDGYALRSGLQSVAAMAGGTFHRVIGSADPFFARVQAESSGFYRLGVEEGSEEAGKDVTVSVRVGVPSVIVHANRTAVSAGRWGTSPLPDIGSRLMDSLRGISTFHEIPIATGVALRRTPEGRDLEINAEVVIPAQISAPVTVMFGLVGRGGFERSGRKVVPAGGGNATNRLTFAVPASPAEYILRVSVADADGRIGSVSLPILARLVEMASIQASNLIASWLNESGQAQFFGTAELPTKAGAVGGLIELYPLGPVLPIGMKVRFQLLGAGASRPIAERDVVPVAIGDVLRSQVVFDVKDLPAGTFVMKAVVLLDGREVGEQQLSFRKVPPGNGGRSSR